MKKNKKQSSQSMSSASARGIVGLVAFLLVGAVAAVGAYWLVRHGFQKTAPVIAEEHWQTLEIPDRLKVRMPGNAARMSQPVQGITMVMYQCAPDKDSVYGVGYSEGRLPADRRSLASDVLLNDSCDGSLANLRNQGAEELGRHPIQLANYPGMEQVIRIPKADGKLISRVFLAGERIYIVMIGGAGIEADHENARRLFDSFAIVEPNVPARPAAMPGQSVHGKSSASDGSTDQAAPPFEVDPRLAVPWTKVFLSDMSEFAVRMGPWKFGKNGVMGDPNATVIKVNGKEAKKGLGMHPIDQKVVRVRYALGGKAARFQAAVALNDFTNACWSPVTFQVVGDESILWTSKPMLKRGEVDECQVSVKDIAVLELRVLITGSNFNAHAVWIDPCLLKG